MAGLGIKKLLIDSPEEKVASMSYGAAGCIGAYLSALLLTLMNPVLVISFAAL